MKTILRDRTIRTLARECATLAHRLGRQRPPSAFVQAAIFAAAGENRLRDKCGVCIGAVELELLERRNGLREALRNARRITDERSIPMTDPINPAALEQDGFVYGIASACVQAMQEVSDAAIPERLISLAARQVAEAGELTPERVAAHLHTTLKAFSATADQLREADTDCARNPENTGAKPR